MDYGRIIKRALQVTWRNKILWIFGIAAALFSGGGGGGGKGIQYVMNSSDLREWRGRMPWQPMPFGVPRRFDWFTPHWESAVGPVVVILLIAALVGFFLLVLSVIVRYTSQGALIDMVNDIEETGDTEFQSGLRTGWSRFLRLFAIQILVGLFSFLAVLVILVVAGIGALIAIGPAIILANTGRSLLVLGVIWAVPVGLVLLLAFVLSLIALGAVVTLVRELASRACIIDGQNVFGSLNAGICLVRRRTREAGLMWLLMVAINMAVGILTIPLVLLGIGALVTPALLVWGVTSSLWATIPMVILSAIVLGGIGMAIGGVYYTFQSSIWTLTYRELYAQQVLSQSS